MPPQLRKPSNPVRIITDDVVTLDWETFLDFMRDCWPPGQHIAIVGPTGEGKTTIAVGLLSIRKYVLALDPKGEDDTLAASGYERVLTVPAAGRPWWWRLTHWREHQQWERIYRRIREGQPARLIVGGASRTEQQDSRLQTLMRQAIDYARYSGGWTLYADEFELLSSQRMFGLGRWVERMLITARRDKTSVVTSFQAAAWVSKHATRQARYLIVQSTGDRAMIKAMAEAMGRDWHALAAAIDELPSFFVLVIPRGKNGGPMILTTAPKVG